MSSTQDQLDGGFSPALARWADQLAVGASWEEVEAEIVTCCQGRVDVLARLLLEAETRGVGAVAAVGRGAARPTVEDAGQDAPTPSGGDRRVLRVAAWRPVDAAVWYVPQ